MWTYVPDNSHEWGDLWYIPLPPFHKRSFADLLETCRNGEDLSIWSSDDADKTDQHRQDEHREIVQKSASHGISHDASFISTSTLSSATVDRLDSQSPPPHTPASIESGSGVSAALILDGSRAIAAVCRPYPIATVGTPERIDFDIASTSFRLQVRVRAEDYAPTAKSGDLVTEIYVPFVHYADSLAPYDASSYPDASSRNASGVSLLPPGDASRNSDKLAATNLRLAIDVRVSVGSYTTHGQYLRWTYPIPSTGEAVHTIEIKRTAGAMQRNLGLVQQQGSWWEVCPNCVIA